MYSFLFAGWSDMNEFTLLPILISLIISGVKPNSSSTSALNDVTFPFSFISTPFFMR